MTLVNSCPNSTKYFSLRSAMWMTTMMQEILLSVCISKSMLPIIVVDSVIYWAFQYVGLYLVWNQDLTNKLFGLVNIWNMKQRIHEIDFY